MLLHQFFDYFGLKKFIDEYDFFAGLGIGLSVGLVVGLVGSLGVGLAAGLVVGLGIGLVVGLAAGLGVGLAAGLGVGLAAGLVVGLGVGLVVGLGVGLGVGLFNLQQLLFLTQYSFVSQLIFLAIFVFVLSEVLFSLNKKVKNPSWSTVFWHKIEAIIISLTLTINTLNTIWLARKLGIQTILKWTGYIGAGIIILLLLVGIIYVWLWTNKKIITKTKMRK